MPEIRLSSSQRLLALVLVAVVAVIALALTVGAAGSGEQAAGTTHTVFLDVAALGRRNRAAKRMNELHAEMATQGYDFADLEVYTENGDLEGFFLTYVRR